MPISQKLKDLIRSAWEDGSPCLVATYGPNGPNISPKGSMVVFDDDHLAYWERSKKQALENLGHEKRICVMYANFAAQRDRQAGVGLPAFLRHRGAARERADPQGDLRQAPAARADPCRRRHRDRRAGQDRARRRRARQAAAVNRCSGNPRGVILEKFRWMRGSSPRMTPVASGRVTPPSHPENSARRRSRRGPCRRSDRRRCARSAATGMGCRCP